MSYETFDHAGYAVKLIQDSDVEAPENDEEVFIVTTRNRYFVKEQSGFELDDIRDGKHSKKYHVFPLYMYQHSGTALSMAPFSCPWDSGQVGYILAAKSSFWKVARKVSFGTIPAAADVCKSFVETWNQYLSGDVWGYTVEDSDGNDVDSCWGFYGLDYARSEAKTAAEYARKHETSEASKVEAMRHV